jgi:hypothetical protein
MKRYKRTRRCYKLISIQANTRVLPVIEINDSIQINGLTISGISGSGSALGISAQKGRMEYPCKTTRARAVSKPVTLTIAEDCGSMKNRWSKQGSQRLFYILSPTVSFPDGIVRGTG